MVNLIPPDAQKQVNREYWIRVCSVWLFLLGSAGVMVVLLYIPSYLLLQTQLKVKQSAHAEVNNQAEQFKQAEEAFTHSNEVAQLLLSSKEEVAFSFVMDEIQKIAPEGIVVTNFSFTRKDTKLEIVTISGQADARASLSRFREALELHPLFKVASLPLSNLAKDRDIAFTISIVPRNKE